MIYTECKLPEYPVLSDVWDNLARETRPIMVYGMGNGADKLFSRFEEYAITPAEVFASDGFVRGHSYRGYRVKSFSEIKESYSDFVIVVSFASNKQDVVDMLFALDGEYELYMPDMPIADTSVYFDKRFYNENYQKILQVYDALCDKESKNCYTAVVNYKLTGKIGYLQSEFSDIGEIYSEIGDVRFAVDVGAYSGDTVKEMKRYFQALRRVIAIEPDRRNFKKLQKYADVCDGVKPELINAAAHSSIGVGVLSESGNRNSTVTATASHEHKEVDVPLVSIDSLGISPDFIKYDVEGAEYEALLGSKSTIISSKPTLLVSLYHKSCDLFELPLLIKEMIPEAKLYLRRIRCLPAWELDLIVK